MALSYTKNTWTDSSTSGSAVTAAKLNAYETAIYNLTQQVNTLTTQVNALKADTGVKYLKNEDNWKVMYRKIGKVVWFQCQCYGYNTGIKANTGSLLDEVLPVGCRPKVKTFIDSGGIGMYVKSSRAVIKPDWTVFLSFLEFPDQYFYASGFFLAA